MQLPLRFILVYGIEGGQPFVIRLQAVPVTDVLQLAVSFYFFTTPLTKSIAQSFQANDRNEEFFKVLPLNHVYSQTISLSDCELLTLYLQTEVLQKFPPTHQFPISLVTKWFKLGAFYHHYYALYNFVMDFIQNYQYFRTEWFKSAQDNIKPPTEQRTQPIIEFEPEQQPIEEKDIPEEIEVVHSNVDVDTLTLINECLQMCPTNLSKFYISKYIQNYLDNLYYEKEFTITLNGQDLVIQLSPLIDVQLLGLSQNHYRSLTDILNSFDFTRDELFHKMRLIVNELIFIIGLVLQSPEKKTTCLLPLKVLELIFFLYSCKVQQLILATSLSKDGPDPIQFHGFMLGLINYYLKYSLDSIDKSQYPYQTISFTHPAYPNISEEIQNAETLEQVLVKERYLLDLDRTSFINIVYDQMKERKETPKPHKKSKLILSNPKPLVISSYIDADIPETSWLCYKNIQEKQKQLVDHVILTKEYHHLLLLATGGSSMIMPLIQKEMHPILIHYADILLNHIFRELITLDTSTSISTLHLLTHYIRPFLNDNATVETELFILYRCVLPYLYDIYKIDTVIDYFH